MYSFLEYYLMEKSINAKEMGNLSPEDEALMQKGKALADKFNLIFNGWWEKFFTFTTKKGKYSFAANNEDEIKQKLTQYESTHLQEMPHVSTQHWYFDFEMEKPGWVNRMIKVVQDHEGEIDELLSPFYGIYTQLFRQKFGELGEGEKNKLRQALDPQFLRDMGVS